MNRVIGAQRRGRFFFVVMAATVIAAVFSGFEPTFYFRGFHAQARPMSVLLHVHGIVFSVWVVLFLAQTLLIARGNYRWHRRLGWALAGVAAAMIVLVILAMVEELRRVNGFPPPPLALALSAFDILVFGVLVGSALYLRRLPEWHKRLMISATIVLLGFGRAHVSRGHASIRNPRRNRDRCAFNPHGRCILHLARLTQ
jgi:uncharacterized membrane protein YozB (DUF420 family)